MLNTPAVAEKRLSLTPHGNVRYQLKTPYRDGTTHVIFEPLDFIARLAVLVPSPRVNLTRFHGVFAPNSKLRAWVTPSQRGKGNQIRVADETQAQPPAERRAAMTWAQRLKRVFSIDIETCSACGGAVKVIACIDEPAVIQKILSHLQGKVAPQPPDLFTHSTGTAWIRLIPLLFLNTGCCHPQGTAGDRLAGRAGKGVRWRWRGKRLSVTLEETVRQ